MNTPFYLQVLEFIKVCKDGATLKLIQHNFTMDDSGEPEFGYGPRHHEQTRIAVWKLEKLELVMLIDGSHMA